MARRKRKVSGFQIATPIAAVILLLILFVSAGYFVVATISDLPPDNSEVLAQLRKNRDLWAREKPAGFRYVVDRDCDCADDVNRPYTVTEIGGDRQAEYPITVEAATGEQLMAPVDPVWLEDLFQRIIDADAGELVVSARFDAALGFPSQVVIRRSGEAGEIVEEYEIRDFEIIYHQ